MEMRPIRKTCTVLLPILFLACALAQTGDDRVGPIASALRNQEFDKALELLHPALQRFPRNAQLWTMQGVAYAGRGQKKEALSSFRAALKISPRQYSRTPGSRPNRIRRRQCGRPSPFCSISSPASRRSDQPRHAGGTGISAGKLQGRGSAFRKGRSVVRSSSATHCTPTPPVW